MILSPEPLEPVHQTLRVNKVLHVNQAPQTQHINQALQTQPTQHVNQTPQTQHVKPTRRSQQTQHTQKPSITLAKPSIIQTSPSNTSFLFMNDDSMLHSLPELIYSNDSDYSIAKTKTKQAISKGFNRPDTELDHVISILNRM